MKYTELTVHTTNEASEIVADAMWNYTDFGVTVCDVNDIIALQKTKDGYWDYIDENLRDVSRTDVLVKCYLEEATAQKSPPQSWTIFFLRGNARRARSISARLKKRRGKWTATTG